MHSALGILLFLACLTVATGCELPNDPEETLERIRARGEIVVGVTEAPPWIRRTSPDLHAEPEGVEAELIREIARREGVRVQWQWGTLEEHFESIEAFRLDLVAGGITDDTPWKKRVGLTRPYVTTKINVGFPPGKPLQTRIGGVRVATEPARPWVGRVRDRDGTVAVSDRPFETGLPVAAPEWQLRAHGFRPRPGKPLHEARQVMAVPPGENGWLTAIEEHLLSREREIESMLVAEERR